VVVATLRPVVSEVLVRVCGLVAFNARTLRPAPTCQKRWGSWIWGSGSPFVSYLHEAFHLPISLKLKSTLHENDNNTTAVKEGKRDSQL